MKSLLVLTALLVAPLTSGVIHLPSGELTTTSQSVKTYKVVLSNPKHSTNREVYIQAPTSSDAGKAAKDQNPGWTVVVVTEVK